MSSISEREVDSPVSVAVEDESPRIPALRYVMRNSESDHPGKTRHLPAHLSIDLRGSERSKGVSASRRQGALSASCCTVLIKFRW